MAKGVATVVRAYDSSPSCNPKPNPNRIPVPKPSPNRTLILPNLRETVTTRHHGFTLALTLRRNPLWCGPALAQAAPPSIRTLNLTLPP